MYTFNGLLSGRFFDQSDFFDDGSADINYVVQLQSYSIAQSA